MPNPTEIDLLRERLTKDEIPFTERTVTVTDVPRSPANAAKIAIVNDLLALIPEEEVNQFFLENLNLAVKVGYKFKTSPENLLSQIDRQHGQTV